MTFHKTRALPALVTVLVLLVPSAALLPGAAAANHGLEIDELSATVDISNHYALTKVRTVVTNGDTEAHPFTLRLASSDLAFITRFAIEANGSVYEAYLENASDARDEYNSAVDSGQSAGLIESRDSNLILLTINVPGGRTLTAHLEFEEMVYRTRGEYRYRFPLASAAGGWEVGALKIEGAVTGRAAVSDPAVSNGSAELVAATSFKFSFAAADLRPDADFWVSWKEGAPAGAGTLFTHTSDGTTYFVHIFSADGAGLATTPLPKDIVFVIDHSGSMSGTKMSQAKEALRAILLQLRTQDRFGVVKFDSSITRWSGSLVAASAENVESARSWVSSIAARGGTDIDGGLTSGIGLFDGSVGRAPVLVFLTDGQPSAGVTDPAKIRANLIARNSVRAGVFTLAFGESADRQLLEQIAAENNGQAKRIYEAQDAVSQIQGFYDTFGTPALTDVKVRFTSGVDTYSPTGIGAAYSGSDLVIVGRLTAGADRVEGTVSGASGSGSAQIPISFEVAGTEGGPMVERAWAYERIQQLERLAMVGDEGAKTEIVDLAMRYHFVTEYTSLVVTVPLEYQVVRPTTQQPYLAPSRNSSAACCSGGSYAPSGVSYVGVGGVVLALGAAVLAVALARRLRK